MNEAAPTVPLAHLEIKLTPADEARFWSKVNKNGPTMPHMDTPCWVWTAYKNNAGYGRIGVGGKLLLAHRITWAISNGPIPLDDLCVCHRCDNPSCCRSDHLFLGRHIDNMRDMTAKGRSNAPSGDNHHSRLHPERLARGDRSGSRLHPESRARGDKNGSRLHPECLARGEANKNSKLTASKVKAIRSLYAAGGTTLRRLAVQFGVHRSLVGYVVNRKIWRHIQ